MHKNFHNLVLGVSVLPALLVMPAVAEVITENKTITEVYTASGHEAERGGDFEARGAKVVFKENASFDNNKTTGEPQNNGWGGAFFVDYVDNSSVEFEKSATFTANEALGGGAVYNENTVVFDSDVLFEKNVAALDGGAFLNHTKSTAEFKGLATFNDNHAKDIGGAFSNAELATMTFDKLATFTKNSSNNQGAIFANAGTLTFKEGLVAKNNTGAFTGIATGGIMNVTGGDFIFSNNTLGHTGIINNGKLTISDVDKITFTNNKSDKDLTEDKTKQNGSAALSVNDVGEGVVLSANTITFDNNHSKGDGYGGAIFSAGNLNIGGATNVFSNNVNTVTGYSTKDETFFGGGAIHVRAQAGVPNAAVVIGKDADSTNTFYNNSTNENGGAIYTRSGADITINGTTVFSKNTSAKKGGAIYTKDAASKITFNGDTTFTGNKDGTGANDIYNAGTINFNGNATLDGGVTGAGTLSIADAKTLNIGTASIEQDTLQLGDGATVNATLLNAKDYASFDVATFDMGTDSLINLTVKGIGEYEVFKNTATSDVDLAYNDKLFVADWNDAGKIVTVSMKSVDEIAANTGLKGESAAAFSNIATAASKSDSALMQELSLKLQEKLAGGDTASVEHVSQAINPETKSVSQSVSSSVQNTVVSLASGRMASPSVGRNGGDVELTSGGVWAQGLFNKSKQADAFNGYTRGIAVGMDGTINKDWTIGAGYSFAHSDITGTARDTEIDSNTVFVYGQYKPTQWYVNAIANYTMSDYSERGTILDGIAVTGDYDVNSFGGALATGYDFANGVTPELGLRYMHVNANDYANSYGIKTHMDDTDFLTGVAGLRYAFDIAATRHMTFAPQLNAAVKYDMLSDKNIATVTMPGLDAYTLEGSRLNRIGGEFGIGLGMQYRSLEMSVNYDIDVREDYTSQTGMLKFRYNF